MRENGTHEIVTIVDNLTILEPCKNANDKRILESFCIFKDMPVFK